jgi:hypothetical protein
MGTAGTLAFNAVDDDEIAEVLRMSDVAAAPRIAAGRCPRICSLLNGKRILVLD